MTLDLPGDKTENDKSLLPGLVARLRMPLASINYRLSGGEGSATVRHPVHELDVEDALHFLESPTFLPKPAWRTDRTYLLGFSCGAFMALNASPIASPPPNRTGGHDRNRIRGVALLEGIYDLPSLLAEYPDYDFVQQAFGSDRDQQASASPTNRIAGAGRPEAFPVLVIHSQTDGLLSMRQPHAFVNRLRSSGAPVLIEEEYERVTGQHFETRDKPEVIERIAEWIEEVEKRHKATR